MQVARVLKEAIEEGKSKADLEARPSPVTCTSIKKKAPNRSKQVPIYTSYEHWPALVCALRVA